MLNILQAIKELSDQIYSENLEDNLSSETLSVMEFVENYTENDPGENVLIVLEDEETYDVSGYVVFCDENELERIQNDYDISSIISEDRWIEVK